MTYNIIIGRNQSDRELFGEKGTVNLGKLYVKMGQYTSLSSSVYMDVARTHVMMICGKRGSGKSYSSAVIAEEIARLPPEIKNRMTVLFFDTMGIFWTMKYPNTRQEELLRDWGLTPESLNITLFTPKGFYDAYKEKGIPTDARFALKTSEMSSDDWCNVFEVKLTEPVGILIERVVTQLHEEKDNYSIQDILTHIRLDTKSEKIIKDATENRFLAAEGWGLFDEHGTTIDDLM
ncbi:MAG: DUF87 domain-containing protein, partial [Nanoarchaeota archaeon]